MIPQDMVLASPLWTTILAACPGAERLLPIEPWQRSGVRVSAAKRVDIQTSTARIKSLDMQENRITALKNIDEHTVHTLLVKLLMAAIGDDIA